MGKLGYLVSALLIIGALVYLLWPEPPSDAGYPVLTGAIPTRYDIVTPVCRQAVDGDRVVIDGRWQRDLDLQAVATFWDLVAKLRSKEIKEGIGPDRLEAFGITGAFAVTAEGLDLRWGFKGETTYLWSGTARRIYAFSKAVFQGLSIRAIRFDEKAALTRALIGAVDTVEVDGLELGREGGT